MKQIACRLTDKQYLMLNRIRDHVAAGWPPGIKGPSLVDILRQGIHAEHARIFGESEHKKILEGTDT